MGTNYYRIPKASEIEQRKERLKVQPDSMPITPSVINDEFVDGTNIHFE